jgi:hypothetical protein
MNSINVCGSDKLNYTPESFFTYTDTYGEVFSFTTADEFRTWWYNDGGPDLGADVEAFLGNPW